MNAITALAVKPAPAALSRSHGVDAALLAKYDGLRVPRYTSYPTAPHFTPEVNGDVYGGWVEAIDPARSGSLYLHVPFCQKMCERLQKPIVSTSANVSGEPSPASFAEISDVIKEGVDYVVRYRQSEQTKHIASNIIKLGLKGEVRVIR